MRILFCAAEADPYAKVGGLADVAFGLPRALARLGHDVRVVIPCHRPAESAFAAAPRHRIDVPGPLGTTVAAEVATIARPGEATVLIVRDGESFPRANIYGEPDDLLRYQFFCRAIAEIVRDPEWQPHIVHLNDWHTAAVAFSLRMTAWNIPGLEQTASVLTVHNLQYRGPDEFNDVLGSGIYYSDAITTVSPRYASEILGWEHGEGLQDMLGLRRDVLSGILNGLDTEVFDPATDIHIACRFDADTLDARDANRLALRQELKMPVSTRPVAGLVARLTSQKGIGILIEAIPGIVVMGVDVIVLGNGNAEYERALRTAEERYPANVRLAPVFDEGLARRVYAGSDFFLMPSRFEPCGLGQMIAMRYGAIPIARRTGGLADTVLDPWEHGDAATGFLFNEYTPEALIAGVETALGAYRVRDWWRRMQRNGMSQDFSWDRAANQYLDVYRAALVRKGTIPPD